VDPESGEVKAWVGGPDFRYFKNDHVMKTKRQVGSTFKPFLYCFAIMNGMSPNTILPNEPVTFPKEHWTLNHNSEGGVGGSITMAGALAQSLNLVSAYLIKQLGPRAVADFAKNKIGFTSDIPAYPSIALGTPEISLYEMLRAYTMFPARGIISKPIYITRIEDRNGNILQTFAPEKKEVISENESYTMVKMMQGVTGPSGTAARLRFRYNITGQVAGKTGTTNDNTDGWFLGYTPQLLAGAWVGCENNFLHFATTRNGQGASTGLPIWAYFFQKVYADKSLKIDDKATFAIPASIENENYSNIQSNVPPGAEAEDQGNGGANDYYDVNKLEEEANKEMKEKEKEKTPAQPTQTPKAVLPPKKDN
jgi:penicillin-binding protein 1A